jgi:hypothetical protein
MEFLCGSLRRSAYSSKIFSKAGGPEPALLFAYRYYFVDSFVGGFLITTSSLLEAKFVVRCEKKGPANADTRSGECR